MLIVSYRTRELTLAAVQSALAVARVGEVIVVDNASGDQTIDVIRALHDSRIHAVENATNAGFGSAHNRAARMSTGDVLLLLNSDATLTDDAVHRLVDEVAAGDGRCLAGPRLLTPRGDIQRSAGLLPAPSDLTVRALGIGSLRAAVDRIPGLSRLARRTRLAIEYESAVTASETIDTNMVSGACFAIGRDAFEGLGGFDERFFMYFEDADLCRRATASGMPIRYVPAAVVSHIGGASTTEDYHFGPLHARSMRQYLGKWYGPAGSALALALLWARAVGFSIALRPSAGRAWRALWAAIRDEDPRG